MLNHVTDTERAFAYRMLWFARGFDAPLESYDQNVAAAGAEADRVSWAAHVEEFRRVRLATISLFRNMPAEGWARSGIVSGNRVTCAGFGLYHSGAFCASCEGGEGEVFVGIGLAGSTLYIPPDFS